MPCMPHYRTLFSQQVPIPATPPSCPHHLHTYLPPTCRYHRFCHACHHPIPYYLLTALAPTHPVLHSGLFCFVTTTMILPAACSDSLYFPFSYHTYQINSLPHHTTCGTPPRFCVSHVPATIFCLHTTPYVLLPTTTACLFYWTRTHWFACASSAITAPAISSTYHHPFHHMIFSLILPRCPLPPHYYTFYRSLLLR